jgi:membrane glycosyltransferase
VLSDTSDPATASREEAEIAAWRLVDPRPGRIFYRRRTDNTGFKAGNLMEFCETLGADYDLIVPLDADSLMSGGAILDLVRIMQGDSQLGIVQGLVVGLPAASAFARMFQFGMRHGMRTYTVGQAWWTHDCGPFWGHNAILRIAPFRAHCRLPLLPGAPPFGGHIMSHDQVEAVLMRRAGYSVRLQAIAGGSWEDNPPTILDYINRDTRWCQGNLQYLRLLGMPGLLAVSRFQLLWAVLMFAGIPALTLLIALLPLTAWAMPGLNSSQETALKLVYWVFMLMFLAPKLAGYLHTASSRHRRARYGSLGRVALGALVEIVFSFLQSSITSFHTACFMAALALGHSTLWSGQNRDARDLSWRQAARAFWPQTLFGVIVNGLLLMASPQLLVYAMPFTLGTLLAIPFAVATSSRRLGAWCVQSGLCAVPEERNAPPEVAALTLRSSR